MARRATVVLIALCAGVAIGRWSAPHGPADARERADLEAALRSLPVPEAAPGSGRITGVVRDAEGRPVKGARVRAVLLEKHYETRVGDPAPEDRGIEAHVRERVRRYHRWKATTIDADSDGEGRYALEGVGDGAYRLDAYLENHELRRVPRYQTFVRAGGRLDFTAHPLVEVPLTVLLPNGSVADHAWLSCKAREGPRTSRYWTPEYGSVRLPPGEHAIEASLDARRDLQCEWVKVRVVAGAESERIEVRLKQRAILRGTIGFAGGLDPDDARVFVLRFGGDAPPNDEALRASGKRTTADRTRPGTLQYAFEDLPSGRYLVAVRLLGQSFVARQVIDFAGGDSRCDFAEVKLPVEAFLPVRPIGPDGRPVAVTGVETSFARGDETSSGRSPWIRRADGSIAVPRGTRRHRAWDRYALAVATEEYGKKRVDYDPASAQPITIRFLRPASLTVTVRGLTESPHAALFHYGFHRPGADRPFREQPLPATGVLDLGPHQPGEWELVLSVQADATFQALKRRVQLEPGRNELLIDVPKIHDLPVLAKQLRPGDGITLRRIDGSRWNRARQEVGEDHTVRFRNVPAGRYRLYGTRGAMRVELKGSARIEFEPRAPDALHIRIDDTSSFLANAGLRSGDILLGIDGTPFEPGRARSAIERALEQGPIKLQVLRGSKRLDLELEGRPWDLDDRAHVISPVYR